ncbi:MAG: hypothetical protein IPM15_07210 [Betaproteobacteria bacterium]|nr:hypothetical protein [Betaproteobacteria bacterium]
MIKAAGSTPIDERLVAAPARAGDGTMSHEAAREGGLLFGGAPLVLLTASPP